MGETGALVGVGGVGLRGRRGGGGGGGERKRKVLTWEVRKGITLTACTILLSDPLLGLKTFVSQCLKLSKAFQLSAVDSLVLLF